MQGRIMRMAMELLESADASQTTWLAGEEWGDDDWRNHYMQVSDANRAELAQKGEELRQRRAARVKRTF